MSAPALPVGELFRKIHAPTVTGHYGIYACRDLMRTADGEIRHYGARFIRHPDGEWETIPTIARSFDHGLNWREEALEAPSPGATVQSPYSGDWLSLGQFRQRPKAWSGYWFFDIYTLFKDRPDGAYVVRSKNGPDGPWETVPTPALDDVIIERQPLALKKRRRWIMGEQRLFDGAFVPVVLISDDDAHSWREIVLPATPDHKPAWPHKGVRWLRCGSEPSIAEYPDGRLHMLLRTSEGRHWQRFSEDGGETWSEQEPSPFYSVTTMPLLFSLSDGRMLAVWNNTAPLPELDHALQPGLDEDARNGVWEDVFTNRDALHAAVSEDMGKSWIGFREIYLNPMRDRADFRSVGGGYPLLDKSIHQAQALELPENKILLSVGQHPACVAQLIFDLDFLYARGRREDFQCGLENCSTQQYVRSHSGSQRGGWSGHCAWNRRAGALLVPAPDGSPREMLQIARHPDPRLLHEKEGMAWNFPAARRGVVSVRLVLTPGSAGMRLTLADRWFNPVDPYAHDFSPFALELDSAGRLNGAPLVEPGIESTVELEYDQDAGRVRFRCGERSGESSMLRPVDGAVSYLHLQSLAESSDPYGVLVSSLEMRTDQG